MLPNLPSSAQQNLFPPPSLSTTSPDGSMSFSLDPYTAKQMAALQATSLAKVGNRSAPGGTSASYLGGMSLTSPTRPDPAAPEVMNGHPSFPQSVMSNFQAHPSPNPTPGHPNPALIQQQSHHQRKRSFLNGLANIMLQRSAPLPPALTGMPYPQGFDPNTSPWRSLEVSTADVGTVRLAGKDIDLYKLWALVLQLGGGQKISSQGMWGQLISQFDLPEHFTHPSGQQQSTALALGNLYNLLIGPFELAYRKNMHEQQHRAMIARNTGGVAIPGHARPEGAPGGFPSAINPVQRQGSNPNVGLNISLGNPVQGADPTLGGLQSYPPPQSLPQTPQQSPYPGFVGTSPNTRPPLGVSEVSASAVLSPQPGSSNYPHFSSQGPEIGPLDNEDIELRKRKMRESEEAEMKRVRQKTNGSEIPDPRGSLPPLVNNHGSNTGLARTIRQPSRRKIEYVPLAREVDTAGGRDLDSILLEQNVSSQRPMRPLDEWGNVDIDALTMSIRSRIPTELSYALSTFTILTLMRGPQSGFPASQAPDLLDEVLDLVEDIAFNGIEDNTEAPSSSCIVTHREMVSSLLDDGTQAFAGLEVKQGAKDFKLGPAQRPGDIIRTVMNILRNLSTSADNHDYFARHDKLLGVVLRLCTLKQRDVDTTPSPVSPALSLADLVAIRKDATQILVNIAANVRLTIKSPPTPTELRNSRRAYELLASYLTDTNDALPPFACMIQGGVPSQMYSPKPPSAIDTALEAFTRLSQPDDNRQALARAVPEEWLWALFEALVHRLPVAESDFSVIMREVWLAYFERIIHALYSLSFLSPPAVKKRIKEDRRLRFPKVMLRLIKKLSTTPRDLRHHFMISVRRAVEAMKLIDDAEDSFDTSRSSALPALSFGMGYGEHGEIRIEKGMGLLSGYQEDITLGIMMNQDLDDMMFSELASLARVG